MRVILVPVADRPECARALETAFDLGRRLGASISGCHLRPHRRSEVSMASAFADSAWRRKSTKTAPAAAKSLYRMLAEQNGYDLAQRAGAEPRAIWSERVGSADKLMAILGPVADLTIVSRPLAPGSIADMFMTAALTESSRPVLLLPAKNRRKVGRHVCIAWNQSGEAAQAVAAAMPILQQALSVTIISCGPEDRVGPKSAQLAGYLAHWGIAADCVATRGRQIEPELLAACKDAGADLLVSGAYSRSRWRERVFGGTTEFLIRKARLPVLMLHG
jgi:nucleotide-binding universal stress UspA family protein